MKATSRFAFLAALALSAACTVHGVDVPELTGPSEFALSVGVTATPDTIAQDGFSQSAIVIQVKDPNNKPVANQTLRIETAANGAIQDIGLLSSRSVVTNSEGRATVIYTAPPPAASQSGGGTVVTFGVTPVGSNYMAANTVMAELRLMPPGVVLPPATAPVSRFTVSPTPVVAGTTAYFDGTASCATSSACSSTAGITAFAWNFGDGSSATGQTTTHVFPTQGTYTVTLTVTNDRGLSHTSTQTVTASIGTAPTAAFVVTPANARVGQAINFNADISKAATGRTIVQYSWNFGDGTPTVSTGFVTQHTYTTAGTYTVVLSVLDDVGQKGTATAQVTVAP